MRKKLLALALAGGMLAQCAGAALAAGPTDFTDLPDDWSRPAIERAIENGLLNGSDGKIDAYGTLTRSQMAAIMVRAFGATAKADLSGYGDVSTDAWYYDDMAKAVAMGVFQGADGKLNPEAPITRQEAFTVLARAFVLTGADEAALADFEDDDQVASWAKEAVAALISGGYVKGSDGKVMPAATMTRAEFAQMVSNLVAAFDAPEGNIEGNVVLRRGETLPAGTVIAGDLIAAEGVDLAELDLSGVTVTGRVVVRGGACVTLGKDTQVGGVVVANTQAPVSVTNDSGSNVDVTVAGSNEVTLNGGYGKVEVSAGNAEVTLADGKVDQVLVSGANAEITVSKDAQVKEVAVTSGADNAAVEVHGKADRVTTAASGTEVSGTGKVSKVEAQAGSEGAKVTTPNTSITVDKEAGAVETDKGTVEPGKNGNSNGNNNSSSSSGSSQSSIAITVSAPAGMTLTIGDTETVTVTATPNNGSAVKSLSAVSSAPSVVTAALAEGVITIEAHQAGMATITVTAEADGCATATKSFRVYVNAPGEAYPDNEAVDVAVEGSSITMTGTLEDIKDKTCSVICMAPGYTGGAAGWLDGIKSAIYIGEFTVNPDGSFTVPFRLPADGEKGPCLLLIGGGDTIILDSFTW